MVAHDQAGRVSWRYADVLEYSPNSLSAGPVTLVCGDWVAGVVAASYGCYVAAVLDTWRAMAGDEWGLSVPAHPPNFGEVDFNKWDTAGFPQLGGIGFYSDGGADLAGDGSLPPRKTHACSSVRRRRR